jgi:ferredoxin
MSKIIHYRDKCIGCGLCHELQPDLWRMSRKDGKATLVNGELKKKVHLLELKEQHEEKIGEVIKGCPVRIIKIL